jgi:hypothetical protein
MATRNRVLAEKRIPGKKLAGILLLRVLAKIKPKPIPIIKGLIAKDLIIGICATNNAAVAIKATIKTPTLIDLRIYIETFARLN